MIALAKKGEFRKTIGQKGREWVINNRSYENMARNVEKLYYQLITKKDQ